MITRLTLSDFGKFKDRSFALAPVTFIYGLNEAGKTTFFDGLFQALCVPSETKKAGKLLKARYGATRRASVEYDLVPADSDLNAERRRIPSGNSPFLNDDEFLNLFAIRAGDLNLELTQGSDWMEKLKAKLFHGGIDPKLLVDEFSRLSSDKRSFVHNRKLEELREKAVKSRQEWEARRWERDNLLARESVLGELEKSWQEARRIKLALDEQLRTMEAVLALEDKIAKRQKIAGQLTRWEDWQSLDKTLLELSAYGNVKPEDWQILGNQVRETAANLQVEQGKRELQAKLVSVAKAECRTLKDAQTAATKRSQTAIMLTETIRKALADQSGFNGSLLWGLIGSGILAVLAVLVFLWAPEKMAGVLGGLFLAGSLISIFLGWRQQHQSKAGGLDVSLVLWKDQWRLARPLESGNSGVDSVAEINTAEGFLLAMVAAVRESETLERREQEAVQRMHVLEQALEDLDAGILILASEAEAARQAEKLWLDRLGLANGSELQHKLAKLAEVRLQLPKRKAELEDLVPDGDFANLGRDLARKLNVFEEEGVPNRGRDEASLTRYRRERMEIQAKRDRADKDEHEYQVRREGLAGEIRGALGNLAAEIIRLEDATAGLEREIQDKEIDKQAAVLALEVFRGMGDGSDQLLMGLAQEMEAMLGRILPAGRSVSLRGLGEGQMQIQDAGGGVRGLEHLSTGTRHAMVLAAKLALALKSWEGPGLVVLDEPFLAMDQARETRALELLQDFHTTHGWQIILLSKDSQLGGKLESLFDRPLLVNL